MTANEKLFPKNASFLPRSYAQINSHQLYHFHLPDDKSHGESLMDSSHHELPEHRGLPENLNRAGHLRGVSGVTHLPRQMVPFPTYPGLQVQLCPLTVLVQIAFSSQLCCPLPHSSCSARRGEKRKGLQQAFQRGGDVAFENQVE